MEGVDRFLGLLDKVDRINMHSVSEEIYRDVLTLASEYSTKAKPLGLPLEGPDL